MALSGSGWSRPQLLSGFDAYDARATAQTISRTYAAGAITSTSSGERRGGLRNRAPECGVVAEEEARASSFQRGEAVERRQHLLAVVHEARQAPLAQRATEIAAIGRQHDFAPGQAQLQRLVPRRVAVGRQADDRAVAEYVVLAVHEAQFVAEVEVARVEAAACGIIGVHTGVPFAALHDEG